MQLPEERFLVFYLIQAHSYTIMKTPERSRTSRVGDLLVLSSHNTLHDVMT